MLRHATEIKDEPLDDAIPTKLLSIIVTSNKNKL